MRTSRLIVELDGRVHHGSPEARDRDLDRDLDAATDEKADAADRLRPGLRAWVCHSDQGRFRPQPPRLARIGRPLRLVWLIEFTR